MSTFLGAWSGYSGGLAFAPGGLALAGNAGFLSNAANAALIALVHARHSSGYRSVQYACWARLQVHKPSAGFRPGPCGCMRLPAGCFSPCSSMLFIIVLS